jgi:hypothetical protein
MVLGLAACGQSDSFPANTSQPASPLPELPAAMLVTNPSGPVITPVQAAAVVRAFWPLNERANATNDRRLTDMLDSGPAAEFEDAVSADNLARPSLPDLRVVRPLKGVEVFVPLQTAFPATFLADVLTTVYGTSPEGDPPGTSSVEVYVFVRPDAATPWRAALRTFGPTHLGVIIGPAGGSYLATLPGSHDLTVDPETVPSLLATYWQRYYDTGAPPPSIFAPGRWTTEKMVALLKEVRQFAADTGIRETTEYSVDLKRDGLFQFAVNGNWDLACFTVRYSTVQIPAAGHVLHQDPARNNYGGSLPPGQYVRITTTGLRQTCAWLPPVGYKGEGVLVMGHEGGNLLVSGIPVGASG